MIAAHLKLIYALNWLHLCERVRAYIICCVFIRACFVARFAGLDNLNVTVYLNVMIVDSYI